MTKKQTRKEIIERSGQLLEICENCQVKKIITKEHNKDATLTYCLEICKHGKEIADLGLKLQLPLEKGGTVVLTKETLKAAMKQGLTWRQMESLFNYTRQTLQRKGRAWGVHFPKIHKKPANALNRYLEYRREGKTFEQIAQQLGCTTRTLITWRKGWGVD